jgi:hypothetical protein
MNINGVTKTFEETFANKEMAGPRLTAVWGRPVDKSDGVSGQRTEVTIDDVRRWSDAYIEKKRLEAELNDRYFYLPNGCTVAEKVRFLVGEEYTLETSTYKEEFVCKAVIDSLEGIPLDIVIMLSKERKNRKKFSLTPSDCKILNIDFEIGLEVYSTMLNWNVKEVFDRYQTKMRNLNKDLTGLLKPHMGIVPFGAVQGLLDSGKRPTEVFDWAGDFHEGYAAVELNGRWNFINTEGKVLTQQWFDDAWDFYNGFARVELNNKYNFIDKEGKILCDQWFDYVYDFYDGYARVELNRGWDLIDTEGRLYELKKTSYYSAAGTDWNNEIFF